MLGAAVLRPAGGQAPASLPRSWRHRPHTALLPTPCRPIVDHAVAHKANMARMKAAYDAAKAGGGAAAAAPAGGSGSAAPAGSSKPAKRARKQ